MPTRCALQASVARHHPAQAVRCRQTFVEQYHLSVPANLGVQVPPILCAPSTDPKRTHHETVFGPFGLWFLVLSDMSDFASPVVRYVAEEHPNADALEMAVIHGWRAACRIGQFSEGQDVAYIPEGALLPWDLVEELELAYPPRLAGPQNNRVKAIRLRGLLSQGLVYGGDRIAGLSIGDDAVEALGLVKWVPQVPVHMNGTMVPGPKITYDIDDFKSWPGRMIEGEMCVITEKLHGTFVCLGLFQEAEGELPTAVVSSKGQLSIGRRFDLDSEKNADNLYVKAWRQHGEAIREVFETLLHGQEWLPSRDASGLSSMYVFGEICGPKVQDISYGLSEPALRIFDVRANGSYADWGIVAEIAKAIGIPPVPVLKQGIWSDGLLEEHTNGASTLATHYREGIVVRPIPPRYDYGQHHESGRGPGRVILKSVNERHLLRKGGTEYN